MESRGIVGEMGEDEREVIRNAAEALFTTKADGGLSNHDGVNKEDLPMRRLRRAFVESRVSEESQWSAQKTLLRSTVWHSIVRSSAVA